MRLLRGGLADETIIKAYAKPHQPKLTGSEESERQTDLREIRAATHDTFIRSSKAMRSNHLVYVDDHGLVLQKSNGILWIPSSFEKGDKLKATE